MSDYRAYIVGSDGHFRTFEALVATDDEQAIAAAQQFVDGCDVEIWQLDRKVTILHPKDSTPPE